MLLTEFLKISEQLENTSSSLEKIEIIKSHISNPYFLSLLTMPAINIGNKVIMHALEKHTGHSLVDIKTEYILEGRMSQVVHKCLNKTKNTSFSAFFDVEEEIMEVPDIKDIYIMLISLLNVYDPGKKIVALQTLFSYTTSPHLINVITGDRSLGVSYSTIFKALNPEDTKSIVRAFALCNNWFILLDNLSSLDKIQPIVLIPISPQLLTSTVLEDHNPELESVEVKGDGVRIQAHIKSDKIELFTRELERKTESIPDFVSHLTSFKKSNNIESAIFDMELLGYDKNDKLLSTDDIMKRLGKNNGKKVTDVTLKCMIFDILHLNGKDTIKLPYIERRKILESFTYTNEITIAITLNNMLITEAFEIAIKEHEGLVFKPFNGLYKPGERTDWKKVKPTLPTFDLIITKALYGKGKNKDVYSSFEVSAQTEDEFTPICNVGIGFDEEELLKLSTQINESGHHKTSDYVEIVNPSIIVEVECEKIYNKNGKISLRFPRKHSIRTDKKDVTSLDEIKKYIKP